MPVDEQQLIQACLNGDPAAFNDLARRYQDRLFNALYRFLNSAEDALDVCQESFLSAYMALENFKGGSRFYTWLYRIAINHAIDLRRRRHRPSVGSDDYVRERQARHDLEAAPERAVLRKEDQTRLQNGLTQLSAEHRLVLVLKEIEGMKYEDIAEVLGVPVGTIRSRLHRARVDLREILEAMDRPVADGTDTANRQRRTFPVRD